MADLEHWERVAQGTPSWHARSQVIAKHILAGSVLDVGAGSQTLKQYLPPVCEYQPCDIVPGTGVLYCDFNTGDWSAIDQVYDYVVCAGVLEYMEDLLSFLRTVCEFFTHGIIMSYEPFRPGLEHPTKWAYRFTQARLEELFDAARLDWEQIDKWQRQLIYRARKL